MFNNYTYKKQYDLTNKISPTTFDIEPYFQTLLFHHSEIKQISINLILLGIDYPTKQWTIRVILYFFVKVVPLFHKQQLHIIYNLL